MTFVVRRPEAPGYWRASIERPADGSRTLWLSCPWVMVRVTV